jgi:hypothetical protein
MKLARLQDLITYFIINSILWNFIVELRLMSVNTVQDEKDVCVCASTKTCRVHRLIASSLCWHRNLASRGILAMDHRHVDRDRHASRPAVGVTLSTHSPCRSLLFESNKLAARSRTTHGNRKKASQFATINQLPVTCNKPSTNKRKKRGFKIEDTIRRRMNSWQARTGTLAMWSTFSAKCHWRGWAHWQKVTCSQEICFKVPGPNPAIPDLDRGIVIERALTRAQYVWTSRHLSIYRLLDRQPRSSFYALLCKRVQKWAFVDKWDFVDL